MAFQLTPSQRATADGRHTVLFESISTHALTEGDDEYIDKYAAIKISTHALTEGDT